MTNSSAPALKVVEAAFAALADEWAGAAVGVMAGGESAAPEGADLPPVVAPAAAFDIRSMSDGGLVRVNEAIATLKRGLAHVHAQVAAELAERSERGRDDNVARQQGFASVERMIAQATGEGFSSASRLVSVGRATAPRASFTGEALPPRYACVATALAAGLISIDAAASITGFLDRMRLSANPDELERAEALLTERAPHVGVDGIARLTKRLAAHLDPDGVKPREDELRAGRHLRIWEDRDGYIRMKGAFDPANGAPISTAVAALVGAELHRARDAARGGGGGGADSGDAGSGDAGAGGSVPGDAGSTGDAGAGGSALGDAGSTGDAAVAESRSIAQMNADALADIARLALGSASAPPALRHATVVARIDLGDLLDGLEAAAAATAATATAAAAAQENRDTAAVETTAGVVQRTREANPRDARSRDARREGGWGTIDGIDQPVSAATIRELAATSGVIPIVLGEAGEVLDLGRSARLFSAAQKLALAERDGGCAFPGCSRPPEYTQAHHIEWWRRDHGRSDLANGILLCSFHHHRVHDDGWTITVREHRTWFTPPVRLDPAQVPRAGNSAALSRPPRRRARERRRPSVLREGRLADVVER